MEENLEKIDHSAIKVSQMIVVALNILAFVLNTPWLAVVVTAVMLAGVFAGVPGFGFVYRTILKPARLVKPDILMDHHEPHRFAQLVGGLFMTAGSLALFAGVTALGWGLVWFVAALSALNAFGGFCVGCMVYYWLARFKLPGFYKSPPGGIFPGMRPKVRFHDERRSKMV